MPHLQILSIWKGLKRCCLVKSYLLFSPSILSSLHHPDPLPSMWIPFFYPHCNPFCSSTSLPSLIYSLCSSTLSLYSLVLPPHHHVLLLFFLILSVHNPYLAKFVFVKIPQTVFNWLIISHTIPTFYDPKKKAFENIWGKGKKCL